jgi:hypothetical protein
MREEVIVRLGFNIVDGIFFETVGPATSRS